jgi:hypothetical protein
MSDIMGGVIIERHYMRPAELKKTGWDKKAATQNKAEEQLGQINNKYDSTGGSRIWQLFKKEIVEEKKPINTQQ